MTTSVDHGLPRRRDGVLVRQSRGENAVFDHQTGALHFLNETAMAIWQLCDGNTRPEEMVAAIGEISRMHPEIIEEDVRRILGEFDRANLLTWQVDRVDD